MDVIPTATATCNNEAVLAKPTGELIHMATARIGSDQTDPLLEMEGGTAHLPEHLSQQDKEDRRSGNSRHKEGTSHVSTNTR